MDLRHLRYFIAVAEIGSLHVAARERLHTAQPSLSRQMRDLEAELGCALMTRSARGIALTAAGRVFLDHARVILRQVDAAGEAARRAAEPPRTTFVLGFLTGYEFDWLAAVMMILREEIPNVEVTVLSRSSPELAAGLLRGTIDLALLRPERNLPGVAIELLGAEPLIVLMPADHRLAVRPTVRPQDLADERLIGVPAATSPVLRAVTDAYAKTLGIGLVPHYEVDNLSMAMSLIVSTGGIALMPLYARNLLPPTVVIRPLAGDPPMIEVTLGYKLDNPSLQLSTVVARIKKLKAGRERAARHEVVLHVDSTRPLPDPTSIYHWHRLDDRITTSGQPTEAELAEISRLGVRKVINLALIDSPRALPEEAATVTALGMDYIHIPVDFAAPTEANFASFCAAMVAVEGEKVHVHCAANYRVSAFFCRYRRDVLCVDPVQARADLEQIWQPDAVWAAFIETTAPRAAI